jgi:hypothetical protein
MCYNIKSHPLNLRKWHLAKRTNVQGKKIKIFELLPRATLKKGGEVLLKNLTKAKFDLLPDPPRIGSGKDF